MFAQDVSDIDALAAELQRDGVVIETALGSGEPTESHDRIAALIRETPFPVYVALVDHVKGSLGRGGRDVSASLATLLHRRIGGQGMYVVGTGDSAVAVTVFGMDADATILSLTSSSNEREIEAAMLPLITKDYAVLPVTIEAEVAVMEAEAMMAKARKDVSESDWEATISKADARALAERSAALVASATWRPGQHSTGHVRVEEASKGKSVALGVTLAVAIAVFLGQGLFGWPRGAATGRLPAEESRRRRGQAKGTPDRVPPVVATEVARARQQIDGLSRRLERTAGRTPSLPERVEQALLARDIAELVLADAETKADPLAAIGAFALARTGDRALAGGLDGGRTERFRPCFFDPRHGHATQTHAWTLGEGSVQVPSCRRCRTRLDAGNEPRSLHRASRRGAPRPYWQDDDIWARTGFGALDEEFVAVVASDRRRRS